MLLIVGVGWAWVTRQQRWQQNHGTIGPQWINEHRLSERESRSAAPYATIVRALINEALLGSMADLRGAKRSLGDMPLVILTHGYGKESPVSGGVSAEVAAKLASGWSETQSGLLRLSSNSGQVIAENSDHFIQREASRLVVAAVREVVGAVRLHAHLDATVLSPLAQLPREKRP